MTDDLEWYWIIGDHRGPEKNRYGGYSEASRLDSETRWEHKTEVAGDPPTQLVWNATGMWWLLAKPRA